MNRTYNIVGSENDRTAFVNNRNSSYINGMTDFITVSVPAHTLVSLSRACEVFDNTSRVPQLSWLKITDFSADLVEDRMSKSEKDDSWGQTIAKMLSEGQVLTYETPFGERNLRAKHIYNAVACTLHEESDATTSSFYAVKFWTNKAVSNFIYRIFFGTSGVYL